MCISDLRWGGGGGGGYSWRDSTVSGVRETSALEARGERRPGRGVLGWGQNPCFHPEEVSISKGIKES